MSRAMLFAALAASAVLGSVSGNEVLAEGKASILHSTEQWRLLKSQLASEEKKLASVEKARDKTESKLAEKTTQMSEVEGRLKRVQELNLQLEQAAGAKDEALTEARSLRKDPLVGAASAQAAASLMSVQLAVDEELKEATVAAAGQRSAELLKVDAEAKKYRSDIRAMKEHLSSEEQELDKARRLARPLAREEEKEIKSAAMLQEQIANHKTDERVARAVELAKEEQDKALQKQQELAELKYDIGNGTILLEMTKGQLKAEKEHAEKSAKEATEVTDRLAETEGLLRTAHQQVSNLSMALTERSHETEAIAKDVQGLKEFEQKDAADAEKKLHALKTAEHDAEARFSKLSEKVSKTEGEVQETMSQIKEKMSASKDMTEENAQRLFLEKQAEDEQSKTVADEYKAALQEAEAKKMELKKKLEQVEFDAASQEAEKIKAIKSENSNASFLMLEATAQSNLRAQQRRNKAQSDKYDLAQSRLKSQITQAKKSAEALLGDSAGEMGVLHEAITKSHALEAATMHKVNKQMEKMMKHTALLQTKFQKEDALVDAERKKAAELGRRIQEVEGQVQSEESKYEATKLNVERIFKAIEKGGAELDDAEVKGMMDALSAEHVHKEHAVSELVAKLNTIKAEVEAAKQAKEEAMKQETTTEQQAAQRRQETQQLQSAQDSLEDLQEEFESAAAERPNLDADSDASVQALLQEVAQPATPAPSFLELQSARKSKFLRAQP
eukprot:gb/GFBE01054525.1/.p1 GENE.gb/GFBE01054525.1/~~gb/GFBE01054525.1/.p1  ORF type:complete len:731 (+),score=309.03 gb/GFBE01054525.1/:1-2193(+)